MSHFLTTVKQSTETHARATSHAIEIATQYAGIMTSIQFELGAQVSNIPRIIASKRHYKKDSRFLSDLYTLTYDEGETLDNEPEVSTKLTIICTNNNYYT
jgi:hypothetical protein